MSQEINSRRSGIEWNNHVNYFKHNRMTVNSENQHRILFIYFTWLAVSSWLKCSYFTIIIIRLQRSYHFHLVRQRTHWHGYTTIIILQISYVDFWSKYLHKLFLVSINIAFHDVHARSQNTLKCSNIQNWKQRKECIGSLVVCLLSRHQWLNNLCYSFTLSHCALCEYPRTTPTTKRVLPNSSHWI